MTVFHQIVLADMHVWNGAWLFHYGASLSPMISFLELVISLNIILYSAAAGTLDSIKLHSLILYRENGSNLRICWKCENFKVAAIDLEPHHKHTATVTVTGINMSFKKAV